MRLFICMLMTLPSLWSSLAAASASPSRSFSAFVDAYFEASLAAHPTQATGIGDHRFDSKLEDLSRSSIERRLAELKGFENELEQIAKGPLTFDESIDQRALLGSIRSEIYEIDVLRKWEVNPMLYAGLPGGAIDSLIKRDFAPPKERLEYVISRLKAIPSIFKAARDNLKNPPREFTDLAIQMAEGSTGYFKSSLPLWARTAAGTDKALLRSFEFENQKVRAESEAFAKWLRKSLLPISKGSYAIGPEAFQNILKFEEMVETPLAELLARGEAQLAKDHADFLETAKEIDKRKTPEQVMKQLSDEHPTAADLIPSVARTVEDARKFLVSKDLITLPSEVRPLVRETPPYDRSGVFASMDTSGPDEHKATEAFYYVTPVEKSWTKERQIEHLRAYNPYVVAMINVHEAFPGHYLQFLYAPRFSTKTRRMISSSSNAEGWAHYSEQMMVDQGFGDGNPKIRLAQLQEALLRDCRYIVGIKLHTEGWTVEQGAQFFEKFGFQESSNAYEEARRGTYNPTYLYYTLGKLEIQALRDDYRRASGASLKQFHDAFVSLGALPIPLVREIMMKGIAHPQKI